MSKFLFPSHLLKFLVFVLFVCMGTFLLYSNEIARFDLRSVSVQAEMLPLELPDSPVQVRPLLPEPSLEDVVLEDTNITHLEFLSSLVEDEWKSRSENEN